MVFLFIVGRLKPLSDNSVGSGLLFVTHFPIALHLTKPCVQESS